MALDRKQQQHLSQRILYGCWEQDLAVRMRIELGSIRASKIATLDMSANVFRFAMQGLAVSYDRPPTVTNSEDAKDFLAELTKSELWSLMQIFQRDTLGIREMLMRVSITEDQRLIYRPVFPHLVDIGTDGLDNRPIIVKEQRNLCDHSGKDQDVIESFDISDPTNPKWQIIDSGGNDVSHLYFPWQNMEDDAKQWIPYHADFYPFRYNNEEPFIPYVLYHAQNTGQVWDAHHSKEITEGTLTLGVGYSFLNHGLRNCTWPQRHAINAVPVGSIVQDEDEADTDGTVSTAQSTIIPSDPALITMWEGTSTGDERATPQLGQWATAFEPEQHQKVLDSKATRILQHAGLNPTDISRAQGDPGSAYAIALTTQSQRRIQKKYEPQFRKGDLELLRKSAALFGAPEDGYSIVYQANTLSPEELKSIREDLQFRLTAGLISLEDAFRQLNPDLTEEQIQTKFKMLGTKPSNEPAPQNI